MDNNTPVRKPNNSTSDLLTWSETPPPDSPSLASAPRSHQPSDGISKVVFGGQVTDEESVSLNKRKPCSGYKMKEMTGSGIFSAANEEDEEGESGNGNLTPNARTGIRMYQQAVSGISHISFGEGESVSPKKPASLPEVAKQRELSGTSETEAEAEARLKKQLSDAKCKELSGHDIFAPPPEILPRPTAVRALALKESIELGEPALREISGNNIFADGKAEHRDYLGGVRKPPGGESSIALV
ncbi:hypothetical protein LINPERPRIM_LOCUS35411 [Linum perenne]